MRFWFALLLFCLAGCSRSPTLRVTVNGLPIEARSLAVSLAVQSEGAALSTPMQDLLPYELPQPVSETDFVLRLPLPNDATLLLGVAAFSAAGGRGCVLALGSAEHLYRPSLVDDEVTLTLTAQVEAASTGCSGTARIIAVAPTGLAAAGGDKLQVMGWGFVPGARIVLNGTALQTRFVSAGQLEATVPPSSRFLAVPLKVELPDGTSLSYSGLRYQARKLAFTEVASFEMHEDILESEVADFNGDGRPDLIFYSDGSYTVSQIKLALQRAPLQFEVSTLPSPADLQRPVICDVDRDGDIDLISASDLDSAIYVFENDGQGGFTQRSYSIGVTLGSLTSVHAVDLDGDNAPEVLLDDDGMMLYTFENDGQGGFSAATRHDTALTQDDYSTVIRSLDFDRDGRQDIVLLGYGLISVLENPGLSPPADDLGARRVAFPTDVYDIGRSFDLDGDSFQDPLLIDETGALVLLPSTTLPARKILEADPGCFAYNIAVADLDGDGNADIATVCDNGEMGFLLQKAPLHYAISEQNIKLSAGLDYWWVRAVDLDGDNKPELIFSTTPLSQPKVTHHVYRNVSE